MHVCSKNSRFITIVTWLKSTQTRVNICSTGT